MATDSTPGSLRRASELALELSRELRALVDDPHTVGPREALAMLCLERLGQMPLWLGSAGAADAPPPPPGPTLQARIGMLRGSLRGVLEAKAGEYGIAYSETRALFEARYGLERDEALERGERTFMPFDEWMGRVQREEDAP